MYGKMIKYFKYILKIQKLTKTIIISKYMFVNIFSFDFFFYHFCHNFVFVIVIY